MAVILTPAYGRDYKSKNEIAKDLLADKDFILNPEGCYINLPQIKECYPDQDINVRYSKLRKVTVFSRGKVVVR